MDWLKSATESLISQLECGLEITGSKAGAIEYAKTHSCAGHATWERALLHLGW